MQHIYGYGQHLEIILNIAPRIYWLDNEASRLAITYKCAGLSGAIWEAHALEAMFLGRIIYREPEKANVCCCITKAAFELPAICSFGANYLMLQYCLYYDK